MQQQPTHPDELFRENQKLRKENERLQALLDAKKSSSLDQIGTVPDELSEQRVMMSSAKNTKNEEALHQSETRLRLIMENMPILLNAFDEKGNIIVWNKACEQSTGYTADEIIGNPKAMEWLYPDPQYRQLVVHMSDDPNANQNTFELTAKNGTKRTITWFDTYQHISIPGWASWGLGLDITERIKAEQELIKAKERAEESDRLKTAFINNISHEIRTPLNSILGFGQFLAEPDCSQQERRENYEFLENSSKRLLQTITDIMDVSLIAAHSIKASKASFAVIPFMNDLLLKTRKKASTKNILVNMDAPEDNGDLNLFTDKELLTKIFDHLISNAVKFTEKGRITLGFQLHQDQMNFYVKDTGKGIAPEKQSMIFDAFAQEDISATRGYEGSGLGLTIAKGLINLLGGRIWLDSATGKGSTFSFTIPHTVIAQQAQTENSTPATVTDKNNILVLVAEDDEANYFYFQELLDLTGLNHLHAINGQEAVEMCEEYPEITLVLMDIKMPVMNGLEATRQIKKLRPELPIIAVTAHAQTGDKNRVIEAGCDAYLSKPVCKQTLEDIINTFIQPS